jgi:hypothetical protein
MPTSAICDIARAASNFRIIFLDSPNYPVPPFRNRILGGTASLATDRKGCRRKTGLHHLARNMGWTTGSLAHWQLTSRQLLPAIVCDHDHAVTKRVVELVTAIKDTKRTRPQISSGSTVLTAEFRQSE